MKMILTGSEDLRVQRTIEAIKNAFEELICETDYEKIKVTELCARARINKKTFYVYYPTLDDLLAEMQMELSAGYIERVKDFKLPDEIDKVNREFFLYSAGQGLAYDKITCAVSYGYVRQQMINKVIDATWKKSEQFMALDEEKRKMLMNYTNAVSVGIYRQWAEDGKTTPIEEIIELSNKLIYSGVMIFFK